MNAPTPIAILGPVSGGGPVATSEVEGVNDGELAQSFSAALTGALSAAMPVQHAKPDIAEAALQSSSALTLMFAGDANAVDRDAGHGILFPMTDTDMSGGQSGVTNGGGEAPTSGAAGGLLAADRTIPAILPATPGSFGKGSNLTPALLPTPTVAWHGGEAAGLAAIADGVAAEGDIGHPAPSGPIESSMTIGLDADPLTLPSDDVPFQPAVPVEQARRQNDHLVPSLMLSQANRMDRLPHRSPAEQVISALDGGPLSELSDPRFSQHQQPLAGIRPPSAVASSPSGLSDGLQPPSAPASQVTLPFAPQTKARAASASPAGLSDNPSKPAHQGQVQHAQAGGDPTIEPLVRALTPTDVQRVAGSTEGGDAEPLFGDLVSGDSVRREFGVTPPAPKPVLQTSQPPGAQIALQIARSHAQGVDRLSVQLHPAELGAVEIRLNFGDDGRVSALIAAERPDTLDLLQRDGRQLERSLNDSGLRLESGGLAFTLKQDQHQQGQGSNASAQHQGRAYQASEALERAENAGPEPLPGRTGNLRLLDIST